jgi:hypothetical protein
MIVESLFDPPDVVLKRLAAALALLSGPVVCAAFIPAVSPFAVAASVIVVALYALVGYRMRRRLVFSVLDSCTWECTACGSRAGLRVELVAPRTRAGTADPENLTAVCRAHARGGAHVLWFARAESPWRSRRC